ncbi:MAG: NAD(P)/FAD-dependent oxidoreductase [Oscillospiraceae bacterium]|nr:NAD(P)/FAD-dependent oxidoreductase [Oscillospiraceae bacterium]
MYKPSEVIVVGGGAAGLICAGTLAARGKRVTVLERSDRPALKLGITGKGRCNLTNNCDLQDILAAVRSNGQFLYSAVSAFSPQDTIDFFERLGVPLKTERGGRVFPASDKAGDVVRALTRYAKENGAPILRERVSDLLIKNSAIAGVRCHSGKEYPAPGVIVATGGCSYPRTGSTGDGYALAAQAGHEIIPTRPSLVPIVTRESWPSQAMGLSLKNVTLTLARKDRVLFKEQGEMLFTHFGVSGPLVLSASAHMYGASGDYTLGVDLKPALTTEQLDTRILRDFAQRSNQNFNNAIGGLLPSKLIDPIVSLSGIDPTTKVHQITREERVRLAGLLKKLPLRVKELRPIDEAVITSGGVSTRQVNPGTMQSKLVDGLYFAGEVLDLDAYTGGFNLQIAFSTGYLAGMKA